MFFGTVVGMGVRGRVFGPMLNEIGHGMASKAKPTVSVELLRNCLGILHLSAQHSDNEAQNLICARHIFQSYIHFYPSYVLHITGFHKKTHAVNASSLLGSEANPALMLGGQFAVVATCYNCELICTCKDSLCRIISRWLVHVTISMGFLHFCESLD